MKEYNLKKELYILSIFCISILFLFTFNVTSSKYMGLFTGEASDVIAIPVISLENPTFSYKPEKMLPGYVDESDFYVSNYDNKNTNEVLMKYYLKLKVNTEIPVKVTLTNEDGIELKQVEGRTDEYELPFDNKVREKYHIKVEWPKEENDYTYAGKDVTIILDLIATQIVEE